MVYTYDMFDRDGDEVAQGLGGQKRSGAGTSEPIPVEVRGRQYGLDPNDILLRAQSFFEVKYGLERGIDFYLRWASVMTFVQDNAEALERVDIVQTDARKVVGIEADFVRMLLDTYSPPVLYGSFPTSPLHEGEQCFNLRKCLDAWRLRKPS